MSVNSLPFFTLKIQGKLRSPPIEYVKKCQKPTHFLILYDTDSKRLPTAWCFVIDKPFLFVSNVYASQTNYLNLTLPSTHWYRGWTCSQGQAHDLHHQKNRVCDIHVILPFDRSPLTPSNAILPWNESPPEGLFECVPPLTTTSINLSSVQNVQTYEELDNFHANKHVLLALLPLQPYWK